MILESLDLKYDILEASDRIEGRILTYRFNGENGYNAPVGTPERYDYYDIGAMRFPKPRSWTVYSIFSTASISLPITY